MSKDVRKQGAKRFDMAPRMSDLERIYMPAMPPLGLFRAIGAGFARMNRRRRIRQLLQYDDRLLRDMGHERRDVVDALRQPPLRDAARMLMKLRRARGG